MPRVLLVEDEAVNLMLMERVISRMHAVVDTAPSGLIAVEKVRALSYAVVFMDISMPDMDGYETTLHIRNVLKSSVPIFALTAHAMDDARCRAREVGMNGFLTKPVNFVELRLIIEQHSHK